MLVLSRKKNESIFVNNNIKITIVEIAENRVRIGIEAPKDIPIHREENLTKSKNGQSPTTGS